MLPAETLKTFQMVRESFIVGKDDFSDLEIKAGSDGKFYYFFNSKERSLVKQFILDDKPKTQCVCQVALIKKGEKFTPRLYFSIRDKFDKKILNIDIPETERTRNIRASINLTECHDNFWKLIGFLQSLSEIDIPTESFSLVAKDESEIVAALRGRDADSIKQIIKQLSTTTDVSLSQEDINQLLKRREKLLEFQQGLELHSSEENWWQNFFDNNKWIFGYGLNYQILRQEQSQPAYGGTKIDGQGGQRGDYLTSTIGEVGFTVLVEIKTPDTPLIQGAQEIRNGAWSLSKYLADALSQIQANIFTWDKEGSEQRDNRDRFDGQDIYTVQPKGIIVIGSLLSIKEDRHKRETFQRFRKSLHGIEIITFDELYSRAKFIIEQND